MVLDLLRLRFNNYLVIDNFFPEHICLYLRDLVYQDHPITTRRPHYDATDYDYGDGSSSLKSIANQYVSPKVSFLKSYIRSWSFVYNNIGKGVNAHKDPDSQYTCNVWVTPNECVENNNCNGLKLYRNRLVDPNWPEIQTPHWNMYSRPEYLKKLKYDIIPYKYNRATIFRSKTIHETDNVFMKPGYQNRRISYTFLYYNS